MDQRKKYILRVISSISFILSIFLILCFYAEPAIAENNRKYFISKYNIYINISTDGSANIEEHITYSFSGNFNGVTFDIDLSGTKGIKDEQVFILKDGKQVEVVRNNSESPGTYLYNLNSSMAKFKVYEPSRNEEKTFIYKYTLVDAVVKYNDIAEFNRKMIGTEWQAPLNNIHIKTILPQGASKGDIRVFGHGPLTGESDIIDEKTVEFKVPAVAPGTFVETRVLFPVKLVPDSKNIVSKGALQDILQSEGKLAEEANLKRENAREQLRKQQEKEKALNVIGTVIFYILLPIWLLLVIYIYLKYDREFKRRFFGKYYRELPGEYTPAEMSLLMTMGKVQSRDVMATLMDLVRKKNLLLEQVTVNKKGLFKNKEVKDYKISLNTEKPLTSLKSHEAFLIKWFINKIGDGNSVLLDDIKDFARDKDNALDFKADYDLWCEKAENEAKLNKFFDDSAKKGKIIGILSSIVIIIIGILMPGIFKNTVGITLLPLGIIMLLFSARIKRRSTYGNEQYAMWKAFKRFLKDFSRLEQAEVPSIILWEHYLVYAISLGVAREVIKQLPLVFKEDDLGNPQLTYLYGMSYGHFSNLDRVFNNTIKTVESSVMTATTIANSRNSSSTGSGGGFSGGSSGGGGGGGGGGAF